VERDGKLVFMKVVELSTRYGQRMLDRLDPESPARSIIKNGVIIEIPPPASRSILQISCDDADAEALLGAARAVCPEAIREIEESLKRF
jgi:hypothetical protein